MVDWVFCFKSNCFALVNGQTKVDWLLDLGCKIKAITKIMGNFDTNSFVALSSAVAKLKTIRICKAHSITREIADRMMRWDVRNSTKKTYISALLKDITPIAKACCLPSAKITTPAPLSRPSLTWPSSSVVSSGSAPPGLVKPGHITLAPPNK